MKGMFKMVTCLFQNIPQVFIVVLVKRIQVFPECVSKEDRVLKKKKSRGNSQLKTPLKQITHKDFQNL